VSNAIEVTSLRVDFGDVTAVADVTFSVAFGEILAVLGPNGAGKTTTTETLLGFRAPTSGAVRLLGLDPLTHHDEVVKSVGALLQRGGVWAPMSPRDVLRLTAQYYAAPRDVNELLHELSLQKCAATPWRRLSGGEQQRTLLALALIGRPRVLVLDDPTAAVDPEGHRVIREMLRRERARGCAILVTTHQLADAEEIADRVVVINDGRVVASGTLDELRTDHAVVVEVSSTLDLTAVPERLAGLVEVAPLRYRVPNHANADLTSEIQAFVQQQGASIRSLRTQASLEERYLEILERDRSAP
jgi:ABC-2 type transport system ATP-binding protein